MLLGEVFMKMKTIILRKTIQYLQFLFTRKSKCYYKLLIIVVMPTITFSQNSNYTHLYVKNIEGDSINMFDLNKASNAIVILTNNLACSGCLTNLIEYLKTNLLTEDKSNVNIVISMGASILEQRQRIMYFKKKYSAINVYFEHVNYDTHESYRKHQTGLLNFFNANGTPVVLLINSKLKQIEVINYDILFNDISVSEEAKIKIDKYLK